MKKILLSLFAVTVVLGSCKKPEDPQPENPNPGGGNTAPVYIGTLEPATIQRPLLVEGTAAWCGYCPDYGTVTMKDILETYPNVLSIALHSGDALSTAYPINTTMLTKFTSSGIPNFYLCDKDGNQNVGQNPYGNISNADSQSPYAGVGNKWIKENDTLKIQTKIKFFEDVTGDYYIATYVLQNHILAVRMTGNDLKQHDYDNILKYSTNGDTTKWKVDKVPLSAGGYAFTANNKYYHDHIVTTYAIGTGTWGKSILGSSGSITANSTYDFNFAIKSVSTWTSDIEIMSIIWKKSGSNYTYVNGYMSK
jgi:hypothetical protein